MPTPVRWYRLVRLLALAGMILGGLLCWPYTRALIEYTSTTGRVYTVDIQPLPNAMARVHVGYEFSHETTSWLCWRQGDVFFRPLPNATAPILPEDVARELAEQLPGSLVRVFFQTNSPGDSAFIMGVDEPRPWQRTIIGGLLLMVSSIFFTKRSTEKNP